MIFSTITQTGLELSVDTYKLPSQLSNGIQIKFVQDDTTYSGYVATVAGALLDSKLIDCAEAAYMMPLAISDGIITIDGNIMSKSGYLVLSITLTKGDENVVLPAVAYKVNASVGDVSILPPDTEAWQQAVSALVAQLMQPYQTNIQSAIDTANAASQAANAAVQSANTAVSTANAASQTATDTSNTINQAIQDGDFIPDVSATAEQGAVGSQPEVSVSGTKEAPVFNFTIPEAQPDLSDTLTAVNNGDESVITDITAGGYGGSEDVYVSTRKQIGETNDSIDILALHAGDGVVFETETIGTAGRATTISAAPGIGYFISQDDESVTIGTYDEWVAAGKPAWPTS